MVGGGACVDGEWVGVKDGVEGRGRIRTTWVRWRKARARLVLLTRLVSLASDWYNGFSTNDIDVTSSTSTATRQSYNYAINVNIAYPYPYQQHMSDFNFSSFSKSFFLTLHSYTRQSLLPRLRHWPN